MTERQPTEAEVLQEEPVPGLETVPVRVVSIDAPVRTQELPRKTLATFSKTIVSGADAVRILTADPYRAKATISGNVNLYYSAHRLGAEDDNTSVFWPSSVPLVITAVSELWVRREAEGDAICSVLVERWATGDTHADD